MPLGTLVQGAPATTEVVCDLGSRRPWVLSLTFAAAPVIRLLKAMRKVALKAHPGQGQAPALASAVQTH